MTARQPAAPGSTLAICRAPDRFAALAPEWHDLYRRSGAATPFQTHPWLHSWWLSYGTPGRLRLVLARLDGRLVAAAPLMLAYRPLPVLVPLGGDISDFFDVLLDDDCAEAADLLARGLRRAARTALIDLREVRPGAAAERLLADWSGPRRMLADSVCMELPVAPMDELLKRLPSSSARRSRGKLRKLDALGIVHRSVSEHEVPAAVATMLKLHGLQWQGRGVTPEHVKPRFAEHLVRATRQMVSTGDALLTEYRIDGEVLATDLTLMSADLAGGYLYGAHPDLRAKADITTMLLRRDAAHAAKTGRRVLSLLRGTESYKHHWRPKTVINQRMLLARRHGHPALVLYTAQLAGRSWIAANARKRLPALRALRTRLNSWRTKGAGSR